MLESFLPAAKGAKGMAPLCRIDFSLARVGKSHLSVRHFSSTSFYKPVTGSRGNQEEANDWGRYASFDISGIVAAGKALMAA